MVDAVSQQPAAHVLGLGNLVLCKKKKKKRMLQSLELTREAGGILSNGKRRAPFLGLLLFQSSGDFLCKTGEREDKEGKSHRPWARAEDRVSQERDLFPTPHEEFGKIPPMAIDESPCQERARAPFLCSPSPAPTGLQVTLNLVAAAVALQDRDKLVLV